MGVRSRPARTPRRPAARRGAPVGDAPPLDAREAREQASRCLDCATAPCRTACPLAIDVPGVLREVARGDFPAAARVLARSNLFPGITGRLCPQESACRATCTARPAVPEGTDPRLHPCATPVDVGRIETFLSAEVPAPGFERAPPSGRRVAVLGAGPAGMVGAGELARLGHAVTAFDSFHVAGGVLARGIPDFRLPRAALAGAIDLLGTLGVRFDLDAPEARSFDPDELFGEGFDAIFLSSVDAPPWLLGVPGETLRGVFRGTEFLTRLNLGADPGRELPGPVMVIGGGSGAVDAARAARRHGKGPVAIAYRRGRAEMTARPGDIDAALDEGVELLTWRVPVALLGDARGSVRRVRLVRSEPGDPDTDGRPRPIPRPGDEVELDARCVVLAVGAGGLPLIAHRRAGLATTGDGIPVITGATFETSRPGVFAVPPDPSGAAAIVVAMGEGRRASAAIDRFLRGEPAAPGFH